MGLELEMKLEPCIKFKTVYKDLELYVYGCEKCKKQYPNVHEYCSLCGEKLDKYKCKSGYSIDIWSITDEELYDINDGGYTYCLNNIKSGLIGLDLSDENRPIEIDANHVTRNIQAFKEFHEHNIEKLKEYAPELEVVFIALKRVW